MAQVVDSNILKRSELADSPPGLLHIDQMLAMLVAGDHPGIALNPRD
jgi:hypothetical protein